MENNVSIRRAHSDRSGEYQKLNQYLDGEGIRMEISASFCPESNGISERYNRSILMKVRSMLSQENLGPEFWVEAASYARRLLA
jgi:hypothetical protein